MPNKKGNTQLNKAEDKEKTVESLLIMSAKMMMMEQIGKHRYLQSLTSSK